MADTFPPDGPTSLLLTIPAYLYKQYEDDDDLQAFFAAYNQLAQAFVDWFNTIDLPIYTGPTINGALLDWVGAGLYGMPRPTLANGQNLVAGPFDTYEFNTLAFNEITITPIVNIYQTDDDTYKRILTWHFFKGDGRVFDVRWLKRRILRFLLGVNGLDWDVSDTSRISVTFGLDNQVNIRLIDSLVTIDGGAFFNEFAFNEEEFNGLQSSEVLLPPWQNTQPLIDGIKSGALELPFQYSDIVTFVV